MSGRDDDKGAPSTPAVEDAPSAGSSTPPDGESAPVTTSELPDVITVDELAAYLRVDRKVLYTAVDKGDIPGVRRIGRLIRIHRDTVLNWLRDGQVRVPRSRRTR